MGACGMEYILCVLIAIPYILLGYWLMGRLDAFLEEAHADQEDEDDDPLPEGR